MRESQPTRSELLLVGYPNLYHRKPEITKSQEGFETKADFQHTRDEKVAGP
jgi:hypothetical protein